MRLGAGIWLDRALNLATGLILVIAVYFLFTERFLPSIREVPTRVPEGGILTDAYAFRPLTEPRGNVSAYRYIPDAKRALLLFYDSSCPACYENLPAWRAAIDAVDPERTMVLAVAVEEDLTVANAYARGHLPEALPVEAMDPREVLTVLGVTIIPHTVLVGDDGTLEFVRPGRLDAAGLTRLLRALGRPGDHNP